MQGRKIIICTCICGDVCLCSEHVKWVHYNNLLMRPECFESYGKRHQQSVCKDRDNFEISL